MTQPDPDPALDIDAEPTVGADDWLAVHPTDLHPEGGLDHSITLTEEEAAALGELMAAGAVGVVDVTAEPVLEAEL
jgi:hypothetical protein